MERKANLKSAPSTIETVKAASAPCSATVCTLPVIKPKLIVAQRRFGRWYVYFQGVAPKDNVGCGCKTAKSAMRYMHLLRSRHGATISQNIYDRLQFEAAKEA